MTFLARQPAGKLTGAREIARAEAIPTPFLWKLLRTLARHRLIRSFKGLRGGYELARPAERIRLDDIVAATGSTDYREACVLGLPACNEQHPCPLHAEWIGIRARLVRLLEQKNLAELAVAGKKRDKKPDRAKRGAKRDKKVH